MIVVGILVIMAPIVFIVGFCFAAAQLEAGEWPKDSLCIEDECFSPEEGGALRVSGDRVDGSGHINSDPLQ